VSNESDEEGDENGREWLMKFRTMKVGPPKHIKPATELKLLGLGVRVTSCGMMSRLEGQEVKKRLKKLHEYPLKWLLCQADQQKF